MELYDYDQSKLIKKKGINTLLFIGVCNLMYFARIINIILSEKMLANHYYSYVEKHIDSLDPVLVVTNHNS